MRRVFAVIGSALFFVLAPGTVAGLALGGSLAGVLDLPQFGRSLYRSWEAHWSRREFWSYWIPLPDLR
jgi:hypothetical protein